MPCGTTAFSAIGTRLGEGWLVLNTRRILSRALADAPLLVEPTRERHCHVDEAETSGERVEACLGQLVNRYAAARSVI